MKRQELDDEVEKSTGSRKWLYGLLLLCLLGGVWLGREYLDRLTSGNRVIGALETPEPVRMRHPRSLAWRTERDHVTLRLWDTVHTGTSKGATAKLADGSQINLNPDTLVLFRPAGNGIDLVVLQGNVDGAKGVAVSYDMEKSIAPMKSTTPVGLNFAGVSDYSSEIVFNDIFRRARGWAADGGGEPGKGLEIGPDGNVRVLRDGQRAYAYIFTEGIPRRALGRYILSWDGNGELNVTHATKVYARRPNSLEFLLDDEHPWSTIQMVRTDPKDPVRNIHLLPPGARNVGRTRFDADFLSRWFGFSPLRFMGWMQTNNSKVATWAQRPKTTTHSYAEGVPVEEMVELSNALQSDPWFCMPHMADNEYVRQFARYVAKNLDPKRKVYIEYSSEVWNTQFTQARYAQEQGLKRGLALNRTTAGLRFYAERSKEVFQLWAAEFGGTSRLVRIVSSQAVNPWTARNVLEWNDTAKFVDALAVAPYFGGRRGTPQGVATVAGKAVEEILQILADDVESARGLIVPNRTLAQKYGKRLIAVEGGQHLVGSGGLENDAELTKLFIAVNRHPRMRELYKKYLRVWAEEGGDIFVHLSAMERPSKFGSWGLIEDTDQPVSQAPKFQAIREYMNLQNVAGAATPKSEATGEAARAGASIDSKAR